MHTHSHTHTTHTSQEVRKTKWIVCVRWLRDSYKTHAHTHTHTYTQTHICTHAHTLTHTHHTHITGSAQNKMDSLRAVAA